jgi:hypothetical protein
LQKNKEGGLEIFFIINPQGTENMIGGNPIMQDFKVYSKLYFNYSFICSGL